MTYRITKAEARAFRDHWRRVNAREEKELRSTSLEVKRQQFNTLMRWAHQLGWVEALGEGEADVRQRWARLRKAYLATKATAIVENQSRKNLAQ